MIDRIIIWLYEHRGKLFLLLCLPLLVVAWQWGAGKYQAALAVGPEHEAYPIPPKHDDDTLRVAVIGDSWAEYHTTLECDTIFCRMAKRLTRKPMKCFSNGHSAKVSKEIYNEMFADRTVEHAWERDYCTQPLIEQHPDYCIIMAGINDLRLYKSTKFYTGNYRLIINLLLKNGIRPVVMEMPDVDFKGMIEKRSIIDQMAFGMLSWITKVDYRSAPAYREAMRNMLDETHLKDSVLFIPVDHWNPGGVFARPEIYLDDRFHLNLDGYHVIDSCMATDIVNDYMKRNNRK